MKKKKCKTPYELKGKPIEVKMEMAKLNVIPMEFRHKFKAGDVVAHKEAKDMPFIVKKDEYQAVDSNDDIVYKATDLVLICPVENRADRKEEE